MSILDLTLLPIRIASHIADAVLHPGPPAPVPTPPADLVVVDGMPEGVPPAARRPEPQLPTPSNWPFGEEFPRTCGAGRLAGGALFWTDFLYDDHGATGIPVGDLRIQAPPRGTYVYPDGNAARNGADIFRVAIGLSETHTWWRIDWNTLLDASVPIALFTFDTDPSRTASAEWPAGAGVRSSGIDMALLVSGGGASLIDLTTHVWTPVEHAVDLQARSFVAQVPRSLVEPMGSWKVRLVAGLANAAGDGFADVPAAHGALPGQPNVYNVAFRTNEQEPPHLNFWSDAAQAAALSSGDVTEFALEVPWARLAARETAPEPVITGPSTRWYVSSIELGQGVAAGENILSTEPQFLGRVQPYSICLPSTYAPGRALPLTMLLHSLSLGQSQFAAIDPRLLHEVCEGRDSVVVTPLARGPSTWYFDTGELDFWEVWARVAEQLGTDPNRTVISGYSMGGYATYKLGLSYPQVFSQAVVLAGPPTCGVRLLPDVDIPADLDLNSPCAREGDTWKLLVNARWLPYVIAHGLADELVPFASAAEQVLELDRLGYRHRFSVYPFEDHIAWVFQDKFEDPISHMGTALRQADPGHITFAWYPQLVRADLGIGPHQVWWLSELTADPAVAARREAVAEVDARSYARPDPTHTIRHHRGFIPHFEPTPGLYSELDWQVGRPVGPLPYLTLNLKGVASLTVDIGRAGLAALPTSTITVSTDVTARIALSGLPAAIDVQLDGEPAGTTVTVSPGRHHITLTAAVDE
ncbi:prolyl oligopeptidase family serine peptidase [Mycobacterium mantenii]|uniref:Peptidase n=1 Tax=Mycobacterium mantenii TaxID=560555 RepID=A0A1A2SQQ7_MYCNT|nr:prolyl oligopeptidase family serine peptidase [Mycobacterium mantenii]OBH42457.1 peptidase [Mycobacterium mantenii]OBH66499.1 peptidase [Mycobacterium mantenii]